LLIQTLTYEQHERPGQHAVEHGDEEDAHGDVVLVEVLEHGHTETLKDVVRVQQTCQHLAEVAHHVAPTDVRRPEIFNGFLGFMLKQ